MIRIQFDPDAIQGSLLIGEADLVDAAGLAVRLRDGNDPLSQYLAAQCSADTRQQLASYDGVNPPSAALRAALINDLNQQIQGNNLYERKRFAGVERTDLIDLLLKLDPKGAGLVCLNRLLLNQAYDAELAKSPKAEWEAWGALARAATAKVIGQWEAWQEALEQWRQRQQNDPQKKEDPPEFKPQWDDDVWRNFRDWLLIHVFRNKCAYCETRIVGFQGDAEHFRPKGRVSIRTESGGSETIKIKDENNEEILHPGYFWLAYHWKNLLPACETCNRKGKRDYFPVNKSHVAVKRLTVEETNRLLYQITRSEKANNLFFLEPDDLDMFEGRLLLHPYFDDPEDHLHFKVDGAAEAWKGSERGVASIKNYNLNDPVTRTARSQEQRDGLQRYFSRLATTKDDPLEWKKAAQGLKDEYYDGPRSYAVAVFDYLHFRFEGTDMDPDRLLGERRKSEP